MIFRDQDEGYDPSTKQIFVFGSNEAGFHGAGAARYAHKYLGAVYGKGIGPQGQSWAIPTKDFNIETLPLEEIHAYVAQFICYAKMHPLETFFITRIGCGLAGYKDIDIAPMWIKAPDNCLLSPIWRGLVV